MTTNKEKQILNSLKDSEYRKALAIEHVNTTLAIQIRKMRENHPWRQSDLAECMGKNQGTISQWENVDYGRHSITTLKELAAAFDVALLVKFIPFSELVKDMVNLSETRLSPPSYDAEQFINDFRTLLLPQSPPAKTVDYDAYEAKTDIKELDYVA